MVSPPDSPPEPVATTYPDLLPPNKTRLERAIAGPTGRLDNAIPVPIDKLLNPEECPTDYLPWLAWHMSLDLWDWRWTETKRRAVIARAVELNRAKGTATGLRKYCEIMDSEVVEILVPPQEFYIGSAMTKAEWDVWIHKMPEIRIKLIEGEGTASHDSWYIQDSTLELSGVIFDSPPEPVPLPPSPVGELQFGWIGQSFFTDDEGPILHGRRIIKRVNGVDYPLQVVERTTVQEESTTIDVERVYVAGKSTVGFFLDNDCIGEKKFLGAAEEEAKIVTVRLDGTYSHETSTLGLTTVWPALKPISPRYERDSDIGNAGPYAFLDDFFIGMDDVYAASGTQYPLGIIQKNRAGDLLADRIFLIDPTVAVPMMAGMSFIGVSRMGMPAFTAEVMVDLHLKEPNDMLFLDDGFVDSSFINDLDETPIDRACYAIRASKAVRDKILVSFAPYRQITSVDEVASDTKAGDWVPDRL